MKRMGLVFIACLCATSLVYAAPPEGKGNPDAKGQGQGQGEERGKGQDRKAENASSNPASSNPGRSQEASSSAANRIERLHPHQARNAIAISDRSQNPAQSNGHTRLAQLPQGAVGHRADHRIRGREAAQAHVESLLKSLNKFEKARWDYNPHDTRGQGNMGKVNMRDPYGFDKDSGREKSERGRPIRETEEPVLNLADLVTVTFSTMDYYLLTLQRQLEAYRVYASKYPNSWYSWYVTYLERLIASYVPPPYDRLAANLNHTVNYTLTFGDVAEAFEGTTLLVTTSLISVNDYTSGFWSYDRTTGKWTYVSVHYDAGQVAVQQTQEVTLSDNGTFSVSYDPPAELAGGWTGNLYELQVTVTEPQSGATYTVTYDRQLSLYRCPYGIVYDKITGKAIAGATVTVHNEDGSVALLDKASNPNVSNPQTTDATGRYNCKLAIGKRYYLSVKAPGYQEYKSPLFSERWHIVREDVGMTPAIGSALPTPPAGELPMPAVSPAALPVK